MKHSRGICMRMNPNDKADKTLASYQSQKRSLSIDTTLYERVLVSNVINRKKSTIDLHPLENYSE